MKENWLRCDRTHQLPISTEHGLTDVVSQWQDMKWTQTFRGYWSWAMPSLTIIRNILMLKNDLLFMLQLNDGEVTPQTIWIRRKSKCIIISVLVFFRYDCIVTWAKGHLWHLDIQRICKINQLGVAEWFIANPLLGTRVIRKKNGRGSIRLHEVARIKSPGNS